MCQPLAPVLAPEVALFRSGGKTITVVRFPMTGIFKLSVPTSAGVGAVRWAMYDPRDSGDVEGFLKAALPFLLQ